MADTTFAFRSTNIVFTWLNQINRYVFGGATASALTSLDTTIYTRFRTLGYYTNGDGGGGDYYYDPLDNSSTVNNGTVWAALGGVGRWKLATLPVTTLHFGCKGDNVTDDTTQFQAAMTWTRLQQGTKKRLVVSTPPVAYLITGALTCGSNQWIEFEPGVVINTTLDINTSLFNAAGQSGVYLYGNGAQLNGNRGGVVLSNSGNQNALYFYGTDNFEIRDFNISGFAMDGITLTGDNGAAGPCTNGIIANCDSYNNGRNGMSVIHAIGVTVDGGRYWNSNGTPSGPWAGIDVEPNLNEVAQAIVIKNVRTQLNAGAGLQFTPGAMSGNTGQIYDVSVFGGRSTADGQIGTSTPGTGIPALYFANGGAVTNEVLGQVLVEGFVIDSPKGMGVGFKNWDAANAPRAILDKVQVINPNGAAGSTGNPAQTGMVIYADSTQTVTNLGKITMLNCKAQDYRGTPKMVTGALISADTGKTIQDVLVVDFTSINYLATDKSPVKTDVANSGNFIDVVVSYTNPKPVSFAGSTSSDTWGGQRVNLTTGASTFTLPLASKCKGMYYEVQVDAAAGSNCTVARTSTDTFKANGVAGATSFTLQPGDIARFRSLGGTVWNVSAVS